MNTLRAGMVFACAYLACCGSPNRPESAQTFEPTIENHDPAPAPAPGGMVWIPGGEFSMGAHDLSDHATTGMKETEDARPIHRVFVDGFYMQTTDVTNQ